MKAKDIGSYPKLSNCIGFHKFVLHARMCCFSLDPCQQPWKMDRLPASLRIRRLLLHLGCHWHHHPSELFDMVSQEVEQEGRGRSTHLRHRRIR